MFLKPTEGFSSRNKDITIISDWIESAVVLLGEIVSKTDVEDVLLEENIYKDKESIRPFIDDCWTELIRRQNYFGLNSFLKFDSRRIRCTKSWEEIPAYSFCLAISLASYYHKEDFIKRNFQEIGLSFETLTKEALSTLFPLWKLFHTGWSSEESKSFAELLLDIENEFGVKKMPNYIQYLSNREKDASLDLILYRPFIDTNYCIPIYLIQCASGQNWVKKIYEPDLNRWDHFIEFNSKLAKGLSIPFSLQEQKFIYYSPMISGFLIDRNRLLAAYHVNKNWESDDLKNKLNAITRNIVESISKE